MQTLSSGEGAGGVGSHGNGEGKCMDKNRALLKAQGEQNMFPSE